MKLLLENVARGDTGALTVLNDIAEVENKETLEFLLKLLLFFDFTGAELDIVYQVAGSDKEAFVEAIFHTAPVAQIRVRKLISQEEFELNEVRVLLGLDPTAWEHPKPLKSVDQSPGDFVAEVTPCSIPG